jgi:hypothetical protein
MLLLLTVKGRKDGDSLGERVRGIWIGGVGVGNDDCSLAFLVSGPNQRCVVVTASWATSRVIIDIIGKRRPGEPMAQN